MGHPIIIRQQVKSMNEWGGGVLLIEELLDVNSYWLLEMNKSGQP